MSKPWRGIGRWAADAERAEAEEERATANSPFTADWDNFPTLKEASEASEKPKKKMAPSGYGTRVYFGGGLRPDERLRLPTNPNYRPADESGRLGGGFHSYRDGAPPARVRSNVDNWGGGQRRYGGFYDDRRGPPPPRVSEFDRHSRADEVDNWAARKKPISVAPRDSGRRDWYGFLGSGSRADEVDNWAAEKKPFLARSGGFGSGIGDLGVDSESALWSRGDWVDEERERAPLHSDPSRRDRDGSLTVNVMTRSSPFGAARPTEEVLAKKGLDLESETKKMSRPMNSHSSSPSSVDSSWSENSTAQSATPKHRGVDRPETEEEKVLKEEINQLEILVAKEDDVKSDWESDVEHFNPREQLLAKERELVLLIRELDDKVRYQGSRE